jgi:hypothetical protein
MTAKAYSRPAGRPIKSNREFASIAHKACFLKNLTDKELAQLFDISEASLHKAKNTYPDFLNSIKRGKEGALVSM